MRTPKNLLIVSVLSLAGIVSAQVVPTQSGRVLDANYSLLTGTSNSVRQADRAIDGNLYVTGQVTGGFEFRGSVGYPAADQLRIGLPSAGLDNFIRSSAGTDVIGSSYYGPSRYLSPTQTILTPAQLARGVNLPGTSEPLSAYIPPATAHRLYDTALKAYEPILPSAGQALWVNPLIDASVAAKVVPGIPVTMTPADLGAVRPEASALFGVLGEADRMRLEEEFDRGQIEGRIDSGVDARVEGAVTESEGSPLPGQHDETMIPGEQQALPAAGENVFLDLLLRLEEKRRAEAQSAIAEGEAEGQKSPGEVGPRVQQPPSGEGEAPVALEAGEVVIHGLVGTQVNRLNLVMKQAQEALSQGRYYDAAGRYRVGQLLSEGQPQASLGLSLALLGANEPFSSALQLERTFRLFPPLMETRVDVAKMLGLKAVDLRIAELEGRLTGEAADAEPSLYMLAAFIRNGMGQREKAAEHAKRLMELAPENPLYRAFAGRLGVDVGAASSATPLPGGS